MSPKDLRALPKYLEYAEKFGGLPPLQEYDLEDHPEYLSLPWQQLLHPSQFDPKPPHKPKWFPGSPKQFQWLWARHLVNHEKLKGLSEDELAMSTALSLLDLYLTIQDDPEAITQE